MKSLCRLVVCCRDRELADLKYQKKLNLCEWHTSEALESLFAGFYPIADPTLHYSQSFATLCIYSKVQLLQALKPEDKPRRKEFAVTMLHRLDSVPEFLKRVCFSDESTFHVSGLINRQNSRIWGSQNPHETYKLERDSPKLNVWCGIMHDKIIGPFFFTEKSITAQIFLDLLTEYVSPQLEQYQPLVIFQQHGAPPHWVLQFVNF